MAEDRRASGDNAPLDLGLWASARELDAARKGMADTGRVGQARACGTAGVWDGCHGLWKGLGRLQSAVGVNEEGECSASLDLYLGRGEYPGAGVDGSAVSGERRRAEQDCGALKGLLDLG